jgi:hypothetical protein
MPTFPLFPGTLLLAVAGLIAQAFTSFDAAAGQAVPLSVPQVQCVHTLLQRQHPLVAVSADAGGIQLATMALESARIRVSCEVGQARTPVA